MSLIQRESAATPVAPERVEPMPSLGGEVTVRGLLLDDRLQFSAWQKAINRPLDGETQEQAWARAGAQAVPEMLAKTVMASDGKSLWGVEQWRAHGARHYAEAVHLFDVAWELSGFDAEAAAKN